MRAATHPERTGRRGTGLLLALSLALLAGCATLTPGAASAPDRVSGRLAVSVEGAPDRSFSAHFDLQGTPEAGQLALSTALGLQIGQARWNASEAELITAEGTRRYPNPQALALDLMGEPIPVQALQDWLHGRPWSGAPHEALPQDPSGFRQLGWHIDTRRQQDGLITATRTTPPPSITVRARLDPR